jgi:hypothetical protein
VIAHLIASEEAIGRFGAPNLTPAEGLTQLTKQHAESEIQFAVIVFALRRVEQLARDRGSFYVNQALANLYESLREILPLHLVVSQIQSTQFAAIITNRSREEVDALVENVLRRAHERCGGVAFFRAGAFVSLEELPEFDGDASDLNPFHALDYARYAVSTPEDKAQERAWFSPETARQILTDLRNRQLYPDVLADYVKLRSLGINNAWVDNQAALAAVSIQPPDKERALEAIRRAIELAPAAPILMANNAYIEFFFGDRVRAHVLFKAIPETFDLPKVYEAPMALAAYAQWQADPTQIDRFLVRDQLAKVATDSSGRLRTEIQSFLMSLESSEPGS